MRDNKSVIIDKKVYDMLSNHPDLCHRYILRLSHAPKNSTVFLFLSQSEMKKSPSFAFNISVRDI